MTDWRIDGRTQRVKLRCCNKPIGTRAKACQSGRESSMFCELRPSQATLALIEVIPRNEMNISLRPVGIGKSAVLVACLSTHC